MSFAETGTSLVDTELTFSEPLLVFTPGGRRVWMGRVAKVTVWGIVILLVIQGLVRPRLEDRTIFSPMLVGCLTVYAIIYNAIQRKIVARPDQIELHRIAAVQPMVLWLSTLRPIVIYDVKARKGLRRIRLVCDQADFTMVVTDDTSKRLAQWALGRVPDVVHWRE